MPIDPQPDIDAQIRKDSRELRVRAGLFEPLVKSDAWLELVKVVREMIDMRVRVVMGQTMTRDDVLQKEYIKGAAYGMELLLTLPSTILAEKRELDRQEELAANASRRSKLSTSIREPTSDERDEFDLGPNTIVTGDDDGA